MSPDLLAFEVIIPRGTTHVVITPAKEMLLQVRLSEALRDYILALSALDMHAENKPRAEYCRLQFNFEFPTLYRSASEEKRAERSCTQNVEQMAEVTVIVTNGVR